MGWWWGCRARGIRSRQRFRLQTLAAMLLRMGVSVPAGAIRVQNLAAVFVSATLPPFCGRERSWTLRRARPGMRARSKAWLLLMTPLYGTDGKIYAQAQGALVVGGYSVSENGSAKQYNHPNTARCRMARWWSGGAAGHYGSREVFNPDAERCGLQERGRDGGGDQHGAGPAGGEGV